MRKHFKKYFVPHKHNQYHPHLFRNTSIITIFVVCAFLLGVSYGNYMFLHRTVLGANIATNVLVDLANENRVGNNVPPLTRNTKLDMAASLKANDMIENKYFAHFAPDGTTPWYFIKQAGYNFTYAGENLAINFTDSKAIDDAWMNSPTHRENLLNTNFKEIGIATKDGDYEGYNTVYVVQMFGSQPKEKVNAAPAAPSAPPKKENLKVIVESKDFISVKNIDPEVGTTSEETGQVAGLETYSSWYDRFIFDSPYYIQVFYIVIVIIILFGVLLRSIIEYKRQHYRHLVISIIFLLVVLVFAAVNMHFINVL